MSLKKVVLPKELIDIPGSEPFAVRGISMADISVLLNQHKSLLESLYQRFTADGVTTSTMDANAIMRDIAATAPALVASIICLAAGDGEDVEALVVAASLPLPVQIEALEKILKLTFQREGGVGKFLETVTRAVAGLNLQVAKL
ncbi:tail protein [Achromobacter phage vB_AchrS_AchV4]|uniref:Tail protein n=1 Tax=Achromobacter phage vB_AchrS_AchV4 TaxID=2796514 RepID=A0A7T3U6V5_9CAUD|nr:tail protein [Achromobacter phage vB_AchrS_AchV4]QPZ53275.1 tail protein [Achromobacter phage vB_AchrS_AchV4]